MQNQTTARKAPWTILDLLNWTTPYFKTHHIDSPRTTAEVLLAHSLNLRRIDLYLQYDRPLSQPELKRFKKKIQRRINREPVAYIVGVKEFWSLELDVTRDVLIPRPETECLVEKALELLPETDASPKRILDLGTGSGAITLALASQRPFHLYFATDVSRRAIALAKKNGDRHFQDRRLHFLAGNWYAAIKKIPLFHMILANPPYIPTGEISGLAPEIRLYEPVTALDGNADGMGCLEHIITQAPEHLLPGGHLLLEMGHDQRERVQETAERYGGFEQIVFSKDYSGYDRVVILQKR